MILVVTLRSTLINYNAAPVNSKLVFKVTRFDRRKLIPSNTTTGLHRLQVWTANKADKRDHYTKRLSYFLKKYFVYASNYIFKNSELSKYGYRKLFNPLFGVFCTVDSHVGERDHFLKNSGRKIFLVFIAYSFVNHFHKMTNEEVITLPFIFFIFQRRTFKM